MTSSSSTATRRAVRFWHSTAISGLAGGDRHEELTKPGSLHEVTATTTVLFLTLLVHAETVRDSEAMNVDTADNSSGASCFLSVLVALMLTV